jgi:hypothetical protein
MFRSYRYGVLLCCLLGATFATQVHAQRAPAPEQYPASSSSPSQPYSPTVSFAYLPALQVATPKPASPYVANDFNGDGTSDLLWFNPSLSQVGYWTMSATTVGVNFSGGGVARTGVRNINVTPGYFVGASGDFNRDGYADLVFTSAKRDLWLWTNNHGGSFTSTAIGSYPDKWQLVGAGDIDGDGYDDLLWVDPSDCQFAYWLMKGGARAGSKVFNIACGYYPMGIGYYSTSNRISIMWTSAVHDLFIWDSTGNGFKSYDLSSYVNTQYDDFGHTWAIGGGFMGNGMGIESYRVSSDGTYDIATGSVYSRTFDARGNQTGFSGGMLWDGGSSGTLDSAGYIIQAKGVNATGLYMIDQANATISTGGLPGSDLAFSGNAPIYTGYDQWSYPVGWYVVGAPANGTAALPWH